MAELIRPARRGVIGTTFSIYLLLFPIPVVLFIAALATDIAYANTAYLMWLHFSEWLIAAGLVFGLLAALTLLVEFFASRAIRSTAAGWTHLVLLCAALVTQLFNSFIHTIDGWTAVAWTGMTLSVIGAVLAVAATAVLYRVPFAWAEYREERP